MRSRLLPIFILIAMLLTLVGVIQHAQAASPGDVVINEIMQNPAAVPDSAGEWFELYNPTGSDIDIEGWTIRDDGIDTHVINNGTPLLIPAGGYLVLGNNTDTGTNGGVPVAYNYGGSWFLSNSADEVILEDTSLVEIDRVEYDGGPSFPDPTGASMALINPVLDNNVGANWCESPNPFGAGDLGTPGGANDCPVVVPEVVINEIMNNPSAVADSAGEWFELFNPTASGIDIEGWTIEDNDFDSHVIANGSPLVIPAGGYLLLGNNTDSGTNGGAPVAYSYGTDMFLSNGGDEVVLLDGGLNEVDRVEYDGGPTFPDPTGASMALIDPALDNNVGANWCTASTPFGDGDLGTPGSANDCPVIVPEVVIKEIMNNPNAVFDSAGEWFEVFNPTGSGIDIEGWTIQDNDFDSHVIANGSPLVIPAGGYLLLGNNADSGTNGGAPVAYSYGTDMFLSNGADEVVLLDGGLNEVDRVEYDGGPTFPDPTGASMSLIDPALDNNVGANWCTASTPFGDGDLGTPGAENDCTTVPTDPFGFCGDGFETRIHAIQGNGLVSPDVGSIRTIEGVVVGDFQGSSNLNGFFLQEEDLHADADPMTSEGIFVFDGSFGVDVAEGDTIRVRGTVTEFFSLTEINTVTDLASCAPIGPASAAAVTLPVASIDEWEYTEGMLNNLSQTLYASGNFNQGRFGEVDLSILGPLDNPTNVVAPGGPANALQDLNNRSRIQMDDGSNVQNPLPLPPYIGAGDTLRTGDTIPGLTGALGFAFGSYEIHPTESVDFTRINARPAVPDVGGSLVVGAYNVLNYFTTLDNSGPICGPNSDQGCRGADNAFEFERQKVKIISAITAMDADVLGLMELENAPDDTPIADLVQGLNAATAPGTYAYIATGAIGGDAIRDGIIYKPAFVTPVGAFAILDSSVDSRFNDEKNRPVLAQTFDEVATGSTFTVAVNHLKSKGSDCNAEGDPDAGDGQGNCNLTRTSAAEALADWLQTDPTGSGDPDFLITGDLNAYAMEDPVVALEDAGYTDLMESFLGIGFDVGAYSFNFFSQSGYLDHALVNSSLLPQVTGAAFWHINADEPRALDYNDFNQPDLFKPDQYRSTDHDPVLVGLNLAPEVTIMEIQDAGHLSPYEGQMIQTTGVVTAVAFNGYYIQDPVGDGNPATADGQFVFLGSATKPSVGDYLHLTGTVSEFVPGGCGPGNLSTTQMSFPSAVNLGTMALPAPVVIGTGGRIPPNVVTISEVDETNQINMQPSFCPGGGVLSPFNPETDGIDFFESLEAMLVTVEDPVAVSATRTFNPFSSEMFTLPNNGHPKIIEPNNVRTERGGINLAAGSDGYGDTNPERVQIQFDPTISGGASVPEITVGDRLDDVTGVVGYSFGNFEVNATHQVTFTPSGLERETTALSGGKKVVTVASYNVLNLSPLSSDDAQRTTLASQIVNNLGSPDVIALQEIQDNNGTVNDGTTDATETMQALADAVVAAGGPSYEFFDVAPADGTSGGVPGGNIRNAFFYNPDRVEEDGFVSLTPDVLAAAGVGNPNAFTGTRNPLAATFSFGGKQFTVINNHLSSRFGSTPIFGGPQLFVQAGETEREAQLQALNDYVDFLLADDKDARVIVLGDFNTFEFTDDLTEILPGTLGGEKAIMKRLLGEVEDDNWYTFIFDGNSQVLDHMFATRSLLEKAEMDIVHVNVDFPRVDPSFGSDHEPLLGAFEIK
jgi:predicted extracellular nuclease